VALAACEGDNPCRRTTTAVDAVTSLFADVRGYTSLAGSSAPAELADRITTLHRWAAAEVGRRHGVVDKFAGDAVMATFNATGARLDTRQGGSRGSTYRNRTPNPRRSS
jgi:adenylate cyclase